jgi:DNA mismatch repair protein MutS2
MPFRSTSLLQFDELKSLIATYAGSDPGKVRVLACEPNRERASVEAELEETGQAIAYLQDASAPQNAGHGSAIRLHFDRLRSIDPAVRLLRVEGARLEGTEILDVFHNLAIAGEYRALLLATGDRYPRLARRAQNLSDLRGLARKYQRAFLPDGTFSDEASVALGRMRRDIERQHKSIQESLERFLRSHRGDGTLQEDFVTVREDRFVVPIIAGQKGRVDGVIHGSSGSGRTLYIEPLETIGLNNQLVRLREDEIREVERILYEITEALREHVHEILPTFEALIEFDFIFAKASFAADYGAVIPKFISEQQRRFVLREARHPLLQSLFRKQRKPVIPISFELDEQRRVLLISGPNTGGKTVTMKTAGLLATMAHAALPVTCAEAEFPWLQDVLADIGDTQSIAESLSTFSGHLLRVKEMLEVVNPDCLVLLDELGGSTDPDEGGALGVAVLDQFRQSGAFCIVSTHLLPLKLYGAQTEGVLNASMGFDDATLHPTYQLRIGMPGRSAGLDIAARLELPAEVIEHARRVLPRMQADLQNVLGRLHGQLEENARLGAELERTRSEFESRRKQVEDEARRREEKRAKEWERKREELIADFEARAMETITHVYTSAEERKAAEQANREVSKAKREFREQAEVVMQPQLPAAAPKPKPVIAEGEKVRLKDIRDPATVRRILKNGLVEVEAGFLRMQVSPEDVVEVLSQADTRSLPKNVTFNAGPRWDVSYRELNLIGKRAEEALEEVDRFLDSAALASVDRVRIIHGHGMGVLKRAVTEYLNKSPLVSRHYPASQSEGGSGATIAELRE